MINILLAILTFIVGSVGYDMNPTEVIQIYDPDCMPRTDSCESFDINNADKVVILYPFGYLITFINHPGEFVLVWDYYDYWAVSLSEKGIESVEF